MTTKITVFLGISFQDYIFCKTNEAWFVAQ